MKSPLSALLLALVLCAIPADAQRYGKLGMELRLTSPAGELSDWHDRGVGVAASAEYDLLGNWRATAHYGFSRFAGKEIRGIPDAAPDLDVHGGAAGVRAYLGRGAVHVGAEFGYYQYRFSRDHMSNAGLRRDFGVLPVVGYRAGSFDVSAQFKIGGDAQWLQLRAAMDLIRF